MKLSIIITNYNYQKFVACAIESALAVRCLNKEIIVVDDGSTDDSKQIISSFGDRIIAIFKPNEGQGPAATVGLQRSTGDIVIFLDSDDTLLPGVAEAVIKVWRDQTVKVQFGQYHVDADGERLISNWPNYNERHTPEWARKTYEQSVIYDAPPTSGNAWSRQFLEKTLPFPVRAFDDYLHALAPAFGEVISIPDFLGEYRFHGNNKSLVSKPFSPERFASDCEFERHRIEMANEILRREAKKLIDIDRSWDHLASHIIYKRFLPSRYPFARKTTALFKDFFAAILRSDMSSVRKIKLLVWAVGVSFAPLGVAHFLCRIRRTHGRPNYFVSYLEPVYATVISGLTTIGESLERLLG